MLKVSQPCPQKLLSWSFASLATNWITRIVGDKSPYHSLTRLRLRDEARSRLLVMESTPDKNLFREVHRRVRNVRDKARKDRDEAARRSEKIAEGEAKKEGFDRPTTPSPSEDGSQ